MSFQLNIHEIIMSQKYFPSASEGNFSTIQQGKFVHIDKGLSPSSVCLRKDYVVFYFFQFVQLVWFNLCQLFNAVIWLVNLSKCIGNSEEAHVSESTVQRSNMAGKFEQVPNECRRRVCVCCYRKSVRAISFT